MGDTRRIAATRPRRDTPLCPLNPVELAVVRHLANGETRPRIARAVDLGEYALDNTITRMFDRVHAVNATNLVAIALRKGWIR